MSFEEETKNFDSVLESLPHRTSYALITVLTRETVFDLDEFRHVSNVEGEELDRILEELIEKGVVVEQTDDRIGKTWTLTPEFREYFYNSREQK